MSATAHVNIDIISSKISNNQLINPENVNFFTSNLGYAYFLFIHAQPQQADRLIKIFLFYK